MKPAPNRLRSILFNLLWPAATAGNLASCAFNYVIWSRGTLGQEFYESMVNSGWAHYAAALAAAVFAFIVTPAAYLASFDRHRSGRPELQLYFLWMSLAASAAGYLLGTAEVGPDNIPVVIGAGLGALLLPLLPIGLERTLGRGKIGGAERMLRTGHPAVAQRLARAGLVFLPSDRTGERLLGLALAQRGRGAQAMPYLKDAYDLGERSPDLLTALAGAEEADGDPARAAKLVEELQSVAPTPQGFERLVRLWLSTGRENRALEALLALSPDERKPWADAVVEMLFERGDRDGLRALAEEFQSEGAPFDRSRRCYERLLDLAPQDAATVEAAADLWERAGDTAGALNLLERLEAITQQSPQPALVRCLAAHYDALGRSAEALRRRYWLVEAGAADPEEKMTVLDDLFTKAEYERCIQLVSADDALSEIPRAAAMLAISWFETERHDRALEQAARARVLGLPADLTAELASMENRIRERRLAAELTDLGGRAEAAPDDIDLKLEYLDRLAAAKSADKVTMALEDLLSRRPDLQERVADAVSGMLERYGRSARLTAYLAGLRLRQGDWDAVYRIAEEMSKGTLHSSEVFHEWTTKILKANPHHAPSLLAEARYESAKGNSTAAYSRVEQYLQAGGERTPEALRLELDTAAAAGSLEAADDAGRQLLQLDPVDLDLQMRLADIALERRDFKTALDRMRAVLAAEPERPHLQLRIRQTEERAKQARIDELRAQIELAQITPAAYEELGDLLHDLGRLNEAIVEYQKASLSDPARHIARAKLGYVLTRKGMYSDAEEELAKAELRPDMDREEQARLKALFFNSAEAMADDGDDARALSLFKRIFHVDAGYRDVLSRIERLQRLVAKKQKQQRH